ncbi:hypothetical protein BKA64DRAFT_223859 [Cadophora sp. MPI-SDFR-AT-0126]|nr:hypothetical protein BKA64DRAFT_223859 [Leotiomycetes sp. MPI-SDFR-AT-0126]
MATAYHARTPEPPSSIRTPGTPRFGAFDDNYQPYTPRKSARVQQRSRDAQTPPPPSRRTHSSNNASTPKLSAIPTSPQTASKKRTPRNSLSTGGRRVSGALTVDSMSSAAASLGLPTPTTARTTSRKTNAESSTALRNTGMLPTPAKTPNERPTQVAPAVRSIARNLFPVRSGSDEEIMPSLKKKGRKYKGFTLDSFEAEEDSTPIQIFTDSHDRVPEVDLSPENPFYGDSNRSIPEPTKRPSKRRKVTVPGEGEQTVEELEQREDGLVYVFRGKKVFRKFGDGDEEPRASQSLVEESESEEEIEGDQTLTSNLRRPLTRSSIKPRLLFPTAEQSRAREAPSHNTEDEEADTDIEEPMDSISTPFDQVHPAASTPKAPRFGPVTPPTTARATRSKKIDVCSSPTGPTSDDESVSTSPMVRNHRTASAKVSPFDQWQRVKPVKPSPTRGGKKREGDSLTRGSIKKPRGHM